MPVMWQRGPVEEVSPPPHPRRIGWVGTTALAMGGSNQSLFLIAALFAGQDAIPGQGSAAVPLLIAGLLLSYAAAPGWTELVLMSRHRVGGIAAACTEAFRPYSDILSPSPASATGGAGSRPAASPPSSPPPPLASGACPASPSRRWPAASSWRSRA